MAQPLNNQRLIIILSAVLLAALVMGVIIYFLLPSKPTETTTESTAPTTFDLSLIQRAGYARLNIRSIQEGSLPVAAPAGVGKANPFL